MPVWIIIAYLAGHTVPVASYLDFAYASADACEQRLAVWRDEIPKPMIWPLPPVVRIECQRIVIR